MTKLEYFSAILAIIIASGLCGSVIVYFGLKLMIALGVIGIILIALMTICGILFLAFTWLLIASLITIINVQLRKMQQQNKDV